MCQYDPSNGGHWIIIEFVSTTPEPFSPFSGCFAAVFDTCREGIAISTTNNPMGSYYVYFLDPNKVNNDPGKGYLLNDFAKIAVSGNALLLFYDEFNLNSSTTPRCPDFGCLGFNGAQEFAFNKNAMEKGLPASSVTVAYENMGNAKNLYPIPENRPFQPESASCFAGRYAGAVCWYQVIPAQTTGVSTNNDQAYMVASLDFFGVGDNRIAVFSWNGLAGLSSENCALCNKITFGGELLQTQLVYMDEGLSCPASQGGFCGLGAQRSGLTPLGDFCAIPFKLNSSDVSSCPESGIASNGDGVTQVWNTGSLLWTSVSTLILQNFKSGSSETHIGAAYWAIDPTAASIAQQGYVTASHADMEFPSLAASSDGNALMTFTLSGSDYYPSSAYVWISGKQSIHITAAGKSPQDGFTEYLGYPPVSNTRPRWEITVKLFLYLEYKRSSSQVNIYSILTATTRLSSVEHRDYSHAEEQGHYSQTGEHRSASLTLDYFLCQLPKLCYIQVLEAKGRAHKAEQLLSC